MISGYDFFVRKSILAFNTFEDFPLALWIPLLQAPKVGNKQCACLTSETAACTIYWTITQAAGSKRLSGLNGNSLACTVLISGASFALLASPAILPRVQKRQVPLLPGDGTPAWAYLTSSTDDAVVQSCKRSSWVKKPLGADGF